MAVAQEASSAVRLEPAASETAERLFQEHSGWIYGYCLRLLRSPEEAEDAVQATYLNACRSLKQGFVPRADSAWLLKVAQNVCITRLRSSGRRARLEALHDTEMIEETVAAPDRRADELIGLPEALATLPEQQRQAILLREWQGLSYREVAAKLRLTQAAVETLIFRARRSLAAALEDPARRRPRALHGLNLGGLATGLKSLVGGSAAAKLAALAAVVATATVVAADPVGWHRPSAPGEGVAPAARTVPVSKADAAPGTRLALAGAEHRALAARDVPRSVREGGGGHGGAFGKAKARAARDKAHGQARSKHVKQAHGQGDPGGGNAFGQASSGRPSFAGSGGPPPHAAARAKTAKTR
jgi:RNA polymerase sigma factor (sigma-70 family)